MAKSRCERTRITLYERNMLNHLFCLVLCVFVCVLKTDGQLQEGDSCWLERERVNGTCVRARHCLSVINDIQKKTYPQTCSFKGVEPIVCCTDCDLVNDSSQFISSGNGYYYLKTGKKASDKCLQYFVSSPPLNSCWLQGGQARIRGKKDNKECYTYVTYGASIGGADASRGEYPHMALLGYGDDLQSAQWLCGGSVISDRFILTAAHCISSSATGPVKFIALGILKRSDPPETWQRYTVRRIIPHPQYKSPRKYHDIALLETNEQIKFSDQVLPICLSDGGETSHFVEKDTAIATGWGALGHKKSLADTLQVVKLQKFSDQECADAYPPHRHLANGYDRNTQFCYGDKKKVIDTCEGDSGGPLVEATGMKVCTYRIIGVTSYGRACGFLGSAGMYTRVAYYVPWIEGVVWP